MTYRDAKERIQRPYFLNLEDAAIEGYSQAQIGDPTMGYRIYMLDEKGNRYSPARETAVGPIENNVYYWHNKDIAKAYMVYLAEAYAAHNRTYGLFRVEAIKGEHMGLYDEHTAHYGQVAQVLRAIDDEPSVVLTPEMLKHAKDNPTYPLFSD